MVLRNLLAVLLMISAVSAAQFTLERAGTLACAHEGTVERLAACAERAVRHEMAQAWKPVARELGLVVSSVALQSAYAEAAKTREGIRTACGN